MFDKIYQGSINWAKRPFKEDGSVVDWFLFAGMMLAIGWLWAQVIKRIGT